MKNVVQMPCWVGILVIASSLSTASAAVVVYDNTQLGFTGFVAFSTQQQGSQITLAGSERIITDINIALGRQGRPGSIDAKIRFWENDGDNGEPETQIWESDIFDDVALSGPVEMISFMVPEIAVPDTFTWTIQLSDNQGPVNVSTGVGLGFSANIGTHLQGWFGDDRPSSMVPSIYVASIVATVPEPTFVTFCSIALVGTGVARRRRVDR